MSGLAHTAESIRVRLVEMLAAISGRPMVALITDFASGSTPGVADVGLDTRQLKQLAQSIQKATGVRVSVWQLLDELTTLDALVGFIADHQGDLPGSDAEAAGRRGHVATPQQAAHLADLDARLAARLPRSRLTDSRLDGHQIPLVTLRASGARLRDIDGNDYIDLACDDAGLLLGHGPPLVRGAIAEQLERSTAIDAAPELASAAAMHLMRLIGSDGARFFASAARARDAALQAARKLRSRRLIVAFRGSGQTDGDADLRWLDYASSEALDWIRSHRDEIAAVLVEMVQPQRAGFHPRSFLRELQAICEVARIPLLLDETLTTLRVHHDLKPDLSIHGSALAAGVSIGALTGRTPILAAIDAEAAATDGVRGEPLALAAADAVLVHWAAHGKVQVEALDRRTRQLADGIDALFRAHGLRTRVAVFGSLFHIDVSAEHPLATLLHAHLRLRGVHLLPGRPGCLSTAHGDAEIEQVLDAFRDSLAELSAIGVFAASDARPTAAATMPQATDAPTAGFISAALRPVTQAAPAAPETPPAVVESHRGERPTSDDDERTRLLAGINRTGQDYPRQHCLQQLIEARAWAAPDAVAVRCGEQQLNYQQLNEQSSKLANLLCLRAPESGPVLVQVAPSCRRLVALLAVLKAGRAWLAIDDSLPAEDGLRLMIDLNASALITDRSGIGDDLLDVIPTISFDADAAALAASPAGRPKVRPDPEAAAWWLARPDGGHARIPHRALVNLLISLSQEPRFQREDRLYAIAAPGSRLELIEMLLPLVVGGQLLIGSPEDARDGAQLRQHLDASDATVLVASPEIIGDLLDAGFRARGGLRLLCNGPRLDRGLANRVHAAGSTELWALHGAPDAAVWSLIERVLPYGDAIHLGRPLANTQIQVLDDGLQPVAIGDTGRLYLGGDGLAPEALDPSASDRHVRNPFGDGRLLRTDDLVSLQADGHLRWQGKALLPWVASPATESSGATQPMPTLAAQLVTGFNVWLMPPAAEDQASAAAPVPTPVDMPTPVEQPADQPSAPEAESDPGTGAGLGASPAEATTSPAVEAAGPSAPQPLLESPSEPLIEPAPDAVALAIATPPAEPAATEPSVVIEAASDDASDDPPAMAQLDLPAALTTRDDRVDALPMPVVPDSAMAEPLPEPAPADGTAPGLEAAKPAAINEPAADTVRPIPVPDGEAEPCMPAPDAASSPPVAAVDAQPVEPSPEPGQCCSAQQRVLWLLDRLEPGSAALAHLLRCSINGPVERSRLEQAWLQLIERHRSLCALFDEQEGELQQRQPVQPVFALGDVDLSMQPLSERQDTAARIAEVEAQTPFDLGHGPLLRATLLRETADHATLLVCAHPIVADRRSLEQLLAELGQLYQALETDQPPTLPPAGDYADYCREQQPLDPDRLREARNYWQRQLAGAHPLGLAHDHPEPLLASTRSGLLMETLSSTCVHVLSAMARRCGVGLDDLVLSGLALLLGRMTGEVDLLIASRHSGRDEQRHAHTVGAFEQPLLLRIDLAGDPTVPELATQIRERLADAERHGQMPLEQQLSLLDAGAANRGRSRLPIAFVVETDAGIATVPGPRRQGLPWLEIEEHRQLGTLHDLEFRLREQAGRWQIACCYRSELNNRSTIDHLLGSLQTVLTQIASSPDRRVSAIEPIEADERRRLLSTSYGRLLPAGKIDVFGRFSIQVTQRPEAEAIRCGNQRLSYRQLDLEAGRMAALIRARIGDTVGARIGFCLPRGPDMVVVMLATMRIGASWVAIDGDEPAERTAGKIADAELSVLVVRSGSGLVLPGNVRSLIDLDVEAPLLSKLGTSSDDVTVPADYEACVYHHGLGTPSLAFRLSFGTVADRLMALADRPGLRAGEVVLATTPVSQEAALIELLLPLMVGASIVIVTDAECRDGRLLLQQLFQQRNQSLVLVGPPQLCQHLLLGGWGGHPPLRVWTCGEMNTPTLNEQLLGFGCELWRLHSVPGAAICAGAHRITRPDDRTIISDVAAGVVVRVLGPQRQLLPIGSSGELYLGGSALAAGRLNDDDERRETDRQTGTAYIRDPFAEHSQGRLLATGEWVRLRGPHTFELLGRRDRIVQIDGWHVDPADIEALLCSHPDVDSARVQIIARGVAEPSVQAWLVPAKHLASPVAMLVEALMQKMSKQLAPIWRPNVIEVVDQLPSATGPEPQADSPTGLGETPAPLAPAGIRASEQRLAALWRELLDLPAATVIPPTASFFELGGHSLLAARLLGRIESMFGRRATLATLRQASGLRALAHWLDRCDLRDFDFRQIVRLQTLGNRPPIIAISNTGLYGALARQLGHAQPFTALQIHDPTQPRIDLPRTLEDTATAYLQLIRRLHPLGPKLLISEGDSAALAFEVARQLSLGEPAAPLLVLLDAERPRHFESLSPLRRVVIRNSRRWQERQRAITSALPPEVDAGAIRPLALHTESHDHWLRGHLARLSTSYVLQPFEGRILLIRARAEAAGWWTDPLSGWGGLALQGVAVETIDCRRAKLLEEPAVSKLAEVISRHIDGLRQPLG